MTATTRLRLASLPILVAATSALLGGPGRPAGAPERARRAAASVEAGWAHTWLSELQERHPYRVRGSANHASAPAFIASSLSAAGAPARLERVEGQVNVLGRIPGLDPTSTVVLAAHHDVVPGAPGAIDDGGAVAVLVSVAQALSALPDPPGCDVVFAVFDGEEEGLRGAKAYVSGLGEDGRAAIRAAIAVELVGWIQDRLVIHTIPSGFAWDAEGVPPSWLPASALAASRDAGVPVGVGDPYVGLWYQGTIRVLGVQTGSDAGAFLEAGIPALMLTGSSLTNFYDAYHTHRDDMTRVDPQRLDDAARALAAAAVELSDAQDPPRELGGAYLLLGESTVPAVGLLLLSLLCLPGLWPVLTTQRSAGDRLGSAATLLLGFGLAVGGLSGSVLSLTVGVPLALSVMAAGALQGRIGTRVVLYLGLTPLLIEGALALGAVASFGFRWRGGVVETLALLAVVPGGCACAAGASRASAAPQVTPTGDDSTCRG